MGTLMQHAHEYFSTINPLAKKILQEQDAIRKSQGDGWDRLTKEEQDEILDKHFIGHVVQDSYDDDNQEYASSFPKLLINSGEKIVVDFDKECWTWRDEHSSPFCWETRSQQDLNIWEDEDDEGLGSDQTEDNSENKKPKKTRRSRSPERDVALAFKPERSIWESPFLAADRGLDAGYHSSQASDQSTKSSCEEPDDILKNFGLALSLSGSHAAMDEEAKLLDSSYEVEDVKADVSDLTVHSSLASVSSDSPESTARSSRKDSKWTNSKKAEAHQSLMSDLNLSYSSVSAHHGQVSPVYVEDPGESSTDVVSEVASSQLSFATEEGSSVPAQEGQVNMALEEDLRSSSSFLDDWKPSFLADEPDNSSSAVSKSGFDFLDNW